MIYSHKPQRSGRSISANTNNPPQDPPPKPIELQLESKYQIQQVKIEGLLEIQKSYELLKSDYDILESKYNSQQVIKEKYQLQLKKITNDYDKIKEKTTSIQLELESKIKDQQTQLDELIVSDILIENSTLPVPELCIEEPKKLKVSWFRRLANIFKRK